MFSVGPSWRRQPVLLTPSRPFFHQIVDLFVLFTWAFESPKSEFVCKSYDQNNISYSARKFWQVYTWRPWWRPWWRRHQLRYFILGTLTPSGWLLTPSPPTVFYSWCLTPSGCNSWRRHLVSSAWKIDTLPFSSLLCSKNVQNGFFSRIHSPST